MESGIGFIQTAVVCFALGSQLIVAPVAAEESGPLSPVTEPAAALSGDPHASPGLIPVESMDGVNMEEYIIDEELLLQQHEVEADAASLDGPDPLNPEPESYEKTIPSVPLEPLYVRELTGIARGRNDSNPVWSPSGKLIAFERSVKDRKEILISTPDGSIMSRIYYQQSNREGDQDFFMPGNLEVLSYNAGITWSPAGDRFVFMSNGGTGNYDLYLSDLETETTIRLTRDPEKDGHAHWSPVSEQLVFVSGRTGKADLYLLDLGTWQIDRLTRGEKMYLYPQWSPDGTKIAVIYGSSENHDIYLIEDVKRPLETIRPLTTWIYDDLRPVWSPDGNHIAFYSSYNREGALKAWSLVVIAADGSDPSEGDGLALKVVAQNVNPDVERGPAWMPDSRRILYVENDRHSFYPIRIVDISDGTITPVKTGTKINHDVVCSPDGTIAFRAQVEQWDHIFLAGLEESIP